MISTDASPQAALETQLRRLNAILERLAAARTDLVPTRATFWTGRARDNYDAMVADVAAQLDDAIDLVTLARNGTMLALAEGMGRA